MIKWLNLLVISNSYVRATDGSGGSSIYSMLSPNSPIFDQSLLGSPLQTANMSNTRPGQLLSFSSDGSLGGGQAMPISPMLLQPPGNIQYANTCDPSEKKEQFKKCLAGQLDKLKNVLENCRKTLGENAKECCVDKKCLDVINGTNSGCGGDDEDSDEKACRNKECRDKIANEILKNINMDQFMKSLLNSLKGSLKKIGGKLGELASCTKNGCKINGGSSISGGDIPQGVLIYPTDPSKYEAITSMLGNQQGNSFPGNSGSPGFGSQRNPSNASGPCSPNGWNGTDGQCPPNWTNQPNGWNGNSGWNNKSAPPGGWNNDTGHSLPTRSSQSNSSGSSTCTPQMCASFDRYDSPKSARNCKKYCEEYRKSQDNKTKGGEDSSDLTSDSCYDDKK